jgi:hypothetical protein
MINSILLQYKENYRKAVLLYDNETKLAHLKQDKHQYYNTLERCLTKMIMPHLLEIKDISFVYYPFKTVSKYYIALNEELSLEVLGNIEFKRTIFHLVNHLNQLINGQPIEEDEPLFKESKGYGIKDLQRIFSSKNLEQFGDFTVEENGAEFYFKITDDETIPFIEGLTYASNCDLLEIFQENTEDGPCFRFKMYDYEKHLTNLNNFGKANIDLTVRDDQEQLNILFNKYFELAEFIEKLSNQKEERIYGHQTAKTLDLLEDYKATHDGGYGNTAIEVNVKCFPDDPKSIPEDFFHTQVGEQINQAAYESWWEIVIEHLKHNFQHKSWVKDVYQVGRSGGYVQVVFNVDDNLTDPDDFIFDEDPVNGEIYGIEHYETLDELFAVLEDTINYIEGEKKYFEERGYKEYVLEEYNYYKEEQHEDTRTA